MNCRQQKTKCAVKFFLAIILLLIACSNLQAQNLDLRILDRINTPPQQPADKHWNTFTDLNLPITIATPLTMLAVGFAKDDRELRIKAGNTAASLVLAEALAYTLKITVKRTRPYDEYPDIIYKKADENSYSFPSGHTTTAFATATSLSLAFPKWYVIVPSYTYACAMAYSRMYLGVHYPSDILGGMVIGIGSSFLVFQAQKWLDKK